MHGHMNVKDIVVLCVSSCVTQSGHGAQSSKRMGILST